MATSGYGNRLAGGNQFFQGPNGALLALGTREGGPRLPPGGSSLLGAAQRPSPTWNYRLPHLPPATLPQGWAPDSAAPPPPAEARPTPELLIDEPITQGRPELAGISL